MTALLDIDQLRTFIAISETGSFTKAADVVNKTQSAVSMQMKRLEERIERPIFSRDGRSSKLTEDGQRLLDYARRIVKLNVETLAAFSDGELSGRVRLGVPDDYADRYLPEIMARVSRAYPGVELTVTCQSSTELMELIDDNELDLAIVTNCDRRPVEVFRRERLLWVSSNRHSVHLEERLPLALGRARCHWRRSAIECLEANARPYHVLFTSANSGAVAAAVLSGLAISVCPESGLRPGMRVLTPAESFCELPACGVGLIRNPHERPKLAEALAGHIISSLDNLSEAREAAEGRWISDIERRFERAGRSLWRHAFLTKTRSASPENANTHIRRKS